MYLRPLNKDQLEGLAKLCFDLAKGGFAFAFFPSVIIPDMLLKVVSMVTGLLIGLAFTYIALLLLQYKRSES